MNRNLQRAVVAMCAISLIACTSLQHIPEGNNAGTSRAHRQAKNVSVGDTIQVNLKNAAPIELVTTAVTSDAITGTNRGDLRTFKLLDVESIEKRSLDIPRTTLLAAGLIFIALGQLSKGISKASNP